MWKPMIGLSRTLIYRRLDIVKAWMLLIGMAASTVFAEEPKTEVSQPAFAAEWRVTAFIRQGRAEEASLEKAGVMARFVREGDHLPGGVVVLGVKYDERQVVLGKGKETAVIQQDASMVPAPKPQPPAAAPAVEPKKSKLDKATAMQDENGRWVVAFPNGKTLDMQSYVDRHGGTAQAIQHVQDLISRETDPERLAYRKQQLTALQQMAATGATTPAATTSTPAATTPATTTPATTTRSRSLVF